MKPTDVDYLYFVAATTVPHGFASTLAEHNRNVRSTGRKYFRDQRSGRPGVARPVFVPAPFFLINSAHECASERNSRPWAAGASG